MYNSLNGFVTKAEAKGFYKSGTAEQQKEWQLNRDKLPSISNGLHRCPHSVTGKR